MADTIRIGFIGAGAANFGGGEGPWDHASRVEKIGGLEVVGIADPNVDRAQAVLSRRQAGPAGGIYRAAGVFADFAAMLEAAAPQAVFIAVPPAFHGRSRPPRDIELACARRGVHMLIEKPLSVAPPNELAPLAAALAGEETKGLIVSVGYMFRYSRAVAAMEELLAGHGPAAVVSARYACAYSQINKPDWWDSRSSGGPIIEQATHFCDLARLLGGQVDLGSIQAMEVSAANPLGKLQDKPAGPDGQDIEQPVPAQFRPPRATLAQWRFAGGAVGSLTHTVLLRGRQYQAQLEVLADGLRLLLDDPYGRCRLHVRLGGDQTEVRDFGDDDPYLTEDTAFIDAIRSGRTGPIRSRYDDAFKTHRFAWAIAQAAQKTGRSNATAASVP